MSLESRHHFKSLGRSSSKNGFDGKPLHDTEAASPVADLKAASRIPDYEYMVYVGDITVGDPPQKFSVVFETSSANLWLPTVDCKKCQVRAKFDPYSSKSFSPKSNDTVIVHLGKSKLVGYYGMDNIVALDGLELDNTNIVCIYGGDVGALKDFRADGIFGLGFELLVEPVVDGAPVNAATMLQVLFDEHRPTFDDGRAHFRFVYPNASNQSEGLSLDMLEQDSVELRFGEKLSVPYPDEKINWLHVMQLDYYDDDDDDTPRSGYGYWVIPVRRIVIGDKGYTTDYMVVDSSERCIAVPSHVHDAYFDGTPHKRPRGTDVEEWPNIVMELNGYQYTIQPTHYLMTNKRGEKVPCLTDGGAYWILGDLFHRIFPVTYDFEKRRIALPATHPTEGWSKWIVPAVTVAGILAIAGLGWLAYIAYKSRRSRLAEHEPVSVHMSSQRSQPFSPSELTPSTTASLS